MKKILLAILFLLAIIAATYKFWPKKTRNNYNIMLIDIDILRADALPCYGYHRNTAPNICEWAKRSMIFEKNYAISPWTLPAMFSTITSLYPTFHNVRTLYTDKLSSEIPTLAEVLHQQGYQTVFIGENSPGLLTKENDGLRGYDQVIADQSIEKVINEISKNSKPWFIHYYQGNLHMPYLLPDGEKPIENSTPPKNLPITNLDFDLSLNIYLKKHYTEVFQKKTIEKNSSIVLAPEKATDTSVTELFYRLSGKNQEKYLVDVWKPIYETYMQSFNQNNPDEVAYVRMMYDTNIKLMDEKLGTLFKKLETKELKEKTVTVLMSDHGEAFGEHGTFAHEYNYHTELFKTPLIIHSPNLKAKQIEQPTSNMDIFPTLLDLVGIKQIDGLQGQSLLSEIDPERFVLGEAGYGGISGAVWQNKNWLYFLSKESTNIKQSILYNKLTDPGEKNNVAKDYPELVELLYKKSNLLRSYETENTVDFNQTDLSPEKIKRLQKEGYF